MARLGPYGRFPRYASIFSNLKRPRRWAPPNPARMERAMEMVSPKAVSEGSAEWQARVDLAAAHRLAVMHGLNEGIFNHLTLRVPGKTDRYLQIPFGTYWSEVTASCFMEVG